MRDLYRGYGDRRGSQRRADLFSARLGSRMKQWGELGKTRTMELTSVFADPNIRDIRAERDLFETAQAEKFSEKAVADLEKAKMTSPATTEGSYVKKTLQRREALQRSKKALQKANEYYAKVGSTFRFDETGYTRLDPRADTFYDDFDRAIESRKQEYAEMYGAESFEDLYGGYGQQYFYESANLIEGATEEAQVGQRDIMDMVMSDMTGMSYEDLASLNLWEVGDEVIPPPGGHNPNYPGSSGMYRRRTSWENVRDYTGEQLESLREFYALSGVQSIEAANRLASAEDESRRTSALESQRATLAGQQKRRKIASEEIAESSQEIQLQLRELDENFMKNIGSFRSAPKKRKVPKISFTEGRPT